jgi:hypothetical protein
MEIPWLRGGWLWLRSVGVRSSLSRQGSDGGSSLAEVGDILGHCDGATDAADGGEKSSLVASAGWWSGFVWGVLRCIASGVARAARKRSGGWPGGGLGVVGPAPGWGASFAIPGGVCGRGLENLRGCGAGV